MPTPRPVERALRKGPLVALVVGVMQSLLFVLGWSLLFDSTHQRVSDGVEHVILRGNEAVAHSLVQALGSFPNGIEPGSADWERAQNVIEGVKLGADGFACILDANDSIVCHPRMRSEPRLGEVNYALATVSSPAAEDQVPLGQVGIGRPYSGTLRLAFEGDHFITTYAHETEGWRLILHQPVSSLVAVSSQMTQGLWSPMLGVGSTIFLLTAVLGFLFLRAHDREVLTWNRGLQARVEEQTEEILCAHQAILYGIAKLSEYRDSDTGLHVERMCAYSAALARELRRRGADLDDDWIVDLELAASLHDIGKVAIPDSILLKPGALTEEEFAIMRDHAEAGADALRAVRERTGPLPLLELGIEIAAGHHERWDGTGYPQGLRGAEIPLSARIVAVADVFDALMSKRVYKPEIPFEQVVESIEQGRGSHFDPEVVDAFHAVSHELLEIRTRLQDTEGPPALLPHREMSETRFTERRAA